MKSKTYDCQVVKAHRMDYGKWKIINTGSTFTNNNQRITYLLRVYVEPGFLYFQLGDMGCPIHHERIEE